MSGFFDSMGFFKTSRPICPRHRHCSDWASKYLKYCLCSTKDGVSLALGLVSVMSWGVAEIPQIITNYREKSTEGLSIFFLMTWIVGDLFNLFGCMLEPATLPTQYYMAVLYTVTTLILAMQTVYYGHIYHQLKFRRCQRTETVEKKRQHDIGLDETQVANGDGWENGTKSFVPGVVQSSPIPLPAVPRNHSPARERYYMSARSLTRSYTPTAGSFPVQRRTPSSATDGNSIEEPLLGEHTVTRSAPPSNTKTMLCVASTMTFFLGTLNLQQGENSRFHLVVKKPNQGCIIQVGRKLLQVTGGLLQETAGTKSSSIGTFLGWGMAAIYMGGRLPQICLNIRRGNVEGLNPLMFVFALVGNATYVASILVSSTDWSKIRPNLPWLVDAGGCVILDLFIISQFIYFCYWSTRHLESKHGSHNGT